MEAAHILPSDPPAPLRADGLGVLRRAIRALEGFPDEGTVVPLGIPAIDAALGGGLYRGALHEIAAAREAANAAATGFALALARRSTNLPANANQTPRLRGEGEGALPPGSKSWKRPLTRRASRDDDPGSGPGQALSPHAGRGAVVWLVEDMALAESGAPYGPGLEEAGLAPERLITVAAAREREMLWAMEEALRCRGVGAVIGETRSQCIDAVATRRLALAAAGSGALALLLRTAPGEEPSSAATRWVVGAAPGARKSHGLGPPRLAVRLMRNRRGHVGSWTLEWNRECFIFATHPQPVAGATFDRPPRADVA
jgi:protein ImuA